MACLMKMVDNLKAKIAEADGKSQQAEQQAKAAQEATVLAEEATKKAERAKAEGMLQAAQQSEGIVRVVSSASGGAFCPDRTVKPEPTSSRVVFAKTPPPWKK